MTLVDWKLFQEIRIDECLSCAWTGKEKMNKAPNIVKYTQRFNQVTYFVAGEVLAHTSTKARAHRLTSFIKIAKVPLSAPCSVHGSTCFPTR